MKPEVRRTEKRTLPISKIRKLIMLAKEQKLLRLKVGDIEIVPRVEADQPPQAPSMSRNGKPMSQRQLDDYVLFGPNGIMEENE